MTSLPRRSPQNRLTSQSTIPSIAPTPAGPPLEAPLFRGSRPLKRWRYVAVFCDELMACAALVQIGPARQSFWALYMREEKLMRERTRLLPRRGEVELDHGRAGTGTLTGEPGRLRVHGRGVLLDLQLEEQAGIEALCPSGRAQVWTRKQAGVAAHGTLQIDGGPAREIEALAVDRRHARVSRSPHRVALERRRRREPGGRRARLEPRQRRQRPPAGQRAGRVGRGRAHRGRARQLRRRPLEHPLRGRRRAALPRRGAAQPPRRAADRGQRLPRAVRHVQRDAARRNRRSRTGWASSSTTAHAGSRARALQRLRLRWGSRAG